MGRLRRLAPASEGEAGTARVECDGSSRLTIGRQRATSRVTIYRAAHRDGRGSVRYRLVGGLVLVSAASLLFEIALTRVYAIAQGHHFAFVAIAMALLGIGAAGTLTATSARIARATLRKPRSAGQARSSLSRRLAPTSRLTVSRWTPTASARMPANCSGWRSSSSWPQCRLPVPEWPLSLLLRHSPAGAGTTYGASLAGSAAGAALAVPLLALVGSAATILLAATLAVSRAGDRRSPATGPRSRAVGDCPISSRPSSLRPLARGCRSTRNSLRPCNVPTPADSTPGSRPTHAWTSSKTPDSAPPRA